MTRRAFHPLLFVIPVFLLLLAAGLVRPTLPSLATSASMTLSLTSGPPTSSVQVKGKGFKTGETVIFTFDTTQVKSVKASTTGSFSTTITVPSSAQPGNHVVLARGKSSGTLLRRHSSCRPIGCSKGSIENIPALMSLKTHSLQEMLAISRSVGPI